jgi:hypothetical protein
MGGEAAPPWLIPYPGGLDGATGLIQMGYTLAAGKPMK